MPEVTQTQPSPAERRLDRQLLLSLMLSPLAAGISTIVGFTVAHWITIVAHKRSGYLVSGSCLALCAIAALLARNALTKLGSADETLPQNGRRIFMAKIALLLTGISVLVVLGGILVLITLQPSD